MSLRLDEQAMMDTVNVLLLSHPGSAAELAQINEINPACVKISSAEGPRTMDASIAILSWRWDMLKGSSLDEMRSVTSPKVVRFIERARALGFQWAWCDYTTVPQFAEDKDELMRHIQSSRTLYQRCTVIVVDVVEVWPGLSVPSLDFQTRLWIAAEKSAVLTNPNVTLATYVQLTRLTHMSIALLIEAPWSPETGLGMHMYSLWLEALLSRDAEAIGSYCGHLRKQGFLFQLITTRGYTILDRAYPGLCAWLGGYFSAKLSPADKVLDESHEQADFAMPEDEQAALVDSYWTIEPDTSPGASPVARVRTPLRGRHPAVRALLDAHARSAKLPRDFSVSAHYAAFLLLASELAYAYADERKFDPGVFENLVVNLGEHPTTPAPEPDAPYALKAFMRSDFAVVKRMILSDAGLSSSPCTIDGVELPEVPSGHKMAVTLSAPLPFAQLVERSLVLKPIDCAARPGECAWKVMVAISETAGACYPSLTLEGREISVTLTDGGMPCAFVTLSANDGLPKSRQMGDYTLARDEVLLILSANRTDMADYSKSKQAMFYAPASRISTGSVRALVGAMLELAASGALAEQPVSRLNEALREIAATCGISPNFAAAEAATRDAAAGKGGGGAASSGAAGAQSAPAGTATTGRPPAVSKVRAAGGVGSALKKLFGGKAKAGTARTSSAV